MSAAAPRPVQDRVFDVAIVGGGLVGASLGLALESTGLSTALIESVQPDAAAQPSFDDRTTALGNGTRRIFEALGVWPTIAPRAAPIREIHVSDAGHFGFARLQADQQGVDAFGYVVTNRDLGAALNARLGQCMRVTRLVPATAVAVRLGADSVEIDLRVPEPTTLRARLAVAADGAHSLVRAAAQLPAEIEDYDQVAIVAHVQASQPQDGTAYERFTASGPLAVLPLQGGGYGVVWTLAPAAAAAAMAWPDATYLQNLQECFGWRVGRLLQVGKRAAYPLKLTRAADVIGSRSVLIGNAAQSLHPVAGQGFNLGLRDAATLAEILARAAGSDVGRPDLLAEFARGRAADRQGVIRFTDGLVKLFGDPRPGVPTLRNLGLLLFDLSPTAKAALSRVSWGFSGRVPRLARGLDLGP